MYNLKYMLFNLTKNLLFTVIFIVQIFVVSITLYSVSNTFIENKNISSQFSNFNLNNLYVINPLNMSGDNNVINVDYKKLEKFIDNYVFDFTLYTTFNYNGSSLEGSILKDVSNYNYKYLDYSNVEGIPIVVGNNYKDKLSVGDKFNLSYYIFNGTDSKDINFDVVVAGILDDNQYEMTRQIQSVDNQILIDYDYIYDLIDNDYKSNFLFSLIINSFVLNNNNVDDFTFRKNIEEKFFNLGYDYNLVPYKESSNDIFLILKGRIDQSIFMFILMVIVVTFTMLNYLKNLYIKRRKIYSIHILFGKDIRDIQIQLIMEISLFILLNYLFVYLFLYKLFTVNNLLLLIIISLEYLLLVIPIFFIKKLDNSLVNLISGGKV